MGWPLFALLSLCAAVASAMPARAEGGAGAELTWYPKLGRVSEPVPLVGVGDDLRNLYRVAGRTLHIAPLDGGRARRVSLPSARWTSLHLAPPTDGEVERCVLVARDGAKGRVALIHLRTGRIIGDWSGPAQVPLGEGESSIHWAPDGQRFFAVGWPLEGPGVHGELALRQVESSLGSIVAKIDVADLLPVTRAALMADGRTVALMTERRLVFLGPGPIDARTAGVPSGSRLIGASADGLVLVRHDRLLVVDGERAGRINVVHELAVDGLSTLLTHARGRFAVGLGARGGLLLDTRKGTLSSLAVVSSTTRLSLLRDRLVLFERAKVGMADLWAYGGP